MSTPVKNIIYIVLILILGYFVVSYAVKMLTTDDEFETVIAEKQLCQSDYTLKVVQAFAYEMPLNFQVKIYKDTIEKFVGPLNPSLNKHASESSFIIDCQDSIVQILDASNQQLIQQFHLKEIPQ